MTIHLITNNKDKARIYNDFFADTMFCVRCIPNEWPEIQADKGIDIAKATLQHYASVYPNDILVREDHSLYLDALFPFPGPYMSYFDKNMSVNTLLSIMESKTPRTGYFELATVVRFPNGLSFDYSHHVQISVAKEAKGHSGNWDKVLVLEGENMSFSEKADARIEAKTHIWNVNVQKLKRDIENYYRVHNDA